MSHVAIRPARPHEADVLTDLAVRSKAHWGYDAAFMEDALPDLTVTPEAIRHSLSGVLEVGGQIAGFYLLRPAPRPDHILLSDLFVEPTCIGQGHGRRLWDHAVAAARAHGYAVLTLDAEPRAAGFYEKLGARQVGVAESRVRAGRFLPVMQFSLREEP
jgi:ribosomal protein S18 acetylase RimI-like enzyme